MKRGVYIFLFLILNLLIYSEAGATHIKAGDISARRISSGTLTYEFTLIVYTDSSSTVDDPEASLDFGDGTSQTVSRNSKISVGNATWKNTYVFIHTFTGAGFFKVGYTEYNRVAAIKNMQQSVNTAFYVETSISIDPFLGVNNSPILLLPPIDEATVGVPFTHNPGAYDPDGDSLAYKLVIPKKSATQTVDGYIHPNIAAGGGSFSLDVHTGDLIWNVPLQPGIYNIAIMVEEWRNGVRIGYVIRDMQIRVQDYNNLPPQIEALNDTCIVAGTSLNMIITATEPENHQIVMTSTGGVYLDPPNLPAPKAVFTPAATQQTSPATATFSWLTSCDHIRSQPYEVTFKAEDLPPNNKRLSDIKSWLIYVKGPKPQNLVAVPSGTSIVLTWDTYACPNADKIFIYRKECGLSDVIPSACQKNIPEYMGYVKIGQVNASVVTYSDNTVKAGVNYCYMIEVQFAMPKGGESYPSDESCSSLSLTNPVLANVTADDTGSGSGDITVRWMAPLSPPFPGPYQYNVYRADGINGTAYSLIASAVSDTFYLDNSIDANLNNYRYRVELAGGSFSESASTISLTTTPSNQAVTLQWNVSAPWLFDSIFIYRKINNGVFSEIHSMEIATGTGTYLDNGLNNCDTVCYYIGIESSFCDPAITQKYYNYSVVSCAVPVNLDPPPAPVLTVDGCDGDLSVFENVLNWTDVEDPFCENIREYRVFWAPYSTSEYSTLVNVDALTYTHMNTTSLAGCYRVAAVNNAGVVGKKSNVVCVDNCVYYELPNLITPEGDQLNDLFEPYPTPRGVQKIRCWIYNQWGQSVFYTEDINILWNATDEKGTLSDGVYYYLVEVTYFRRMNPEDEIQELKGWVHVISQKKSDGER